MKPEEDLVDARLITEMQVLNKDKHEQTANFQSLDATISTATCEAIWLLRKLAEIRMAEVKKPVYQIGTTTGFQFYSNHS